VQQVQEPSKWDGIAFTQRAQAVPMLGCFVDVII
jgi:hypothetical protein